MAHSGVHEVNSTSAIWSNYYHPQIETQKKTPDRYIILLPQKHPIEKYIENSLSLYLSIYLSIYHLSIYLSIFLSHTHTYMRERVYTHLHTHTHCYDRPLDEIPFVF